MNKLMVLAILSLTVVVSTADARSSGGSSGGGFRSTSPSRSSGISLSKPTPAPTRSPGIVLTKPTPTPTAPTPVAPAKSPGIVLTKPTTPQPVVMPATPQRNPGIVLTKPTTTPSQSFPNRNNTITVVHEHHYFGGGYGYGRGYYGGYSGGFGSSPFFWLWLMDRPQPQQVVVNGQASGNYGAPPAASTGETVVNVLLGVLMLTGIVALVVWIIRKVFV